MPISSGLDVTFSSYQYGGGGADGLAFVLAAVDPANPVPPTTIGQPGGALGYSSTNSSTTGLADGYLGIGLDVFGNFSNKFEGSGCTDPSNISSRMPGQVVVRGPGNGTVGYCPLLSSAATSSSASLALRASTRSASAVPVEVVFNPGTSSVTTSSGLTVPGGDYDVTFTPVGGSQRSLIGALPVVPSGLYPSSWLNSAGYPKQLAFGSSDPTGMTLTNTVSSGTIGSNCPDGSTDPACTATVVLTAQTISMSDLTGSFTLTGLPGTTQQQDGAVSLRVASNSPDGYTVSVQPDTQDLTSAGSPDTIPFGDLEVRGQAQGVFRALSGPVLVEQATGPSAAGGDLLSNDYQMVIPDVRSAAYTGTLTYIATATP